MKKIGNCYWVHKTALNQFDKEIVNYITKKMELVNKPYDVIRYDSKGESVSFIKVQDWDKQKEPVLVYSIRVSKDNVVKIRKESFDNPNIYHQKELFVNSNYKGFSVEKAKERTSKWKSLKLDSKRIGRLKYWKQKIEENGLEL